MTDELQCKGSFFADTLIGESKEGSIWRRVPERAVVLVKAGRRCASKELIGLGRFAGSD